MNKVFFLDENIIKIDENGRVTRVEYKKIKFLRHIVKEIKSTPKKYKTPDEIIKRAAVSYTGEQGVVPRLLRGRGITDSSLYMSLRNLVNQNHKYLSMYLKLKKKKKWPYYF